jgi:hypothetical protein
LKIANLKLPAHRARLPGNVMSFHIVPLDPAYKAGFAGHAPVKMKNTNPPSPPFRKGGLGGFDIENFVMVILQFGLKSY